MTLGTDKSSLRGDVFRFGGVRQKGRTIRFGFDCSRYGAFTEEVELTAGRQLPTALLTLLHVALGVSTYKAAAARKIVLPPLTPAGRRMAEALFTEGLAEFFVRAGLAYPPSTEFVGEAVAKEGRGVCSGSGALVAFGGGKDSYVAGRIIAAADGEEPRFASVVLSDAVEATLRATAPAEPVFVRRRLDPKLLSLRGGFGGHVPITAINILVLTAEAYLRGMGAVVFANERSADEPTMDLGGVAANHQYSKSSAFEALVRDAVREAAPEAPACFSVLRPFSELWIAERFAAIGEAHGRFTSCNRNFRLAGDAERRWCGACAKCAFTSLVLSAFLTPRQAEHAFGRVLLGEPALQPFYRELCGLTDQKPWDCVGTIAECQAALYLLSRSATWRDAAPVKTLLPEILRATSEAELAEQVEDARTPLSRGAVPERFYRAALAL